MDERSDMDKSDEVMLPGFRFHPTDEELIGFYLKRKIQQKPLSIELIRELEIYKYDPWDLPKMASTGEKEWYFYCPRDRKYRNSARPNRVTRAGFWKATGTDRPIYSSEGTRCIGLKKSLVFYKGRAAKGIKTDWMMHEFRLPSLTDSSLPRRPLDKNIPANDSWAICRIFKKTSSMAQRALSQSWMSPLPEIKESYISSVSQTAQCAQFGSESISCITEPASAVQFSCSKSLLQQHPNTDSYSYDVSSNKPTNLNHGRPSFLPVSSADIPTSFMLSSFEMPMLSMSTTDMPSMFLNITPTILGDTEKASASINFGQPQDSNAFMVDLPVEINEILGCTNEETSMTKTANTCAMNNGQWETPRIVSFPFNLPTNLSNEWKSN
ncbi:protein FEZ-like [Typha latifolia]|uniref:protein FEZ-like n=1 Tax=Typha latifolia TaxID=4733 RepID=UPI003C2DDE3E